MPFASRCARADRHFDIEQALVHGHRQAIGGGISGRAVDLDVAALFDARRDQRDIAAACVDLRAGHDLDAACAGLGFGEGGGKAVAAGREAVRQVDRAEQQAADVEHGIGADDDPAGAVEPDVAAGRAAGELAEDAAVKLDAARRVGRHDAVENGEVGKAGAALIGRGVAGRQEVDGARALRSVGAQLIVAVLLLIVTVSVPGVARSNVTEPAAVVGVPWKAWALARCGASAAAAMARVAQEIRSLCRQGRNGGYATVDISISKATGGW